MDPEDSPWNVERTVTLIVHPGSADDRAGQHEKGQTKEQAQADFGKQGHLRSAEDEDGNGND